MAVIQPSRVLAEKQSSVSILYTWPALQNGDEGEPVPYEFCSDRTVQSFGTFDTGSVTLMGSMDKVNWSALSDPQGNVLTLSTAKIETVLEVVKWVKPVVGSGAGTTEISCHLLMVGSVQ